MIYWELFRLAADTGLVGRVVATIGSRTWTGGGCWTAAAARDSDVSGCSCDIVYMRAGWFEIKACERNGVRGQALSICLKINQK